MSEENAAATTEAESEQQGQPSALDQFATKLTEIKNEEGKPKYNSLDKALDGLKHSQEYIPQLKDQLAEKEAELERLRQENQKMNDLDEKLQMLLTQKESSTEESTDVAALVRQEFEKNAIENQKQSNLNSVVSHIQSVYGEGASTALESKAKELDMTVQELSSLAQQKPKLVQQMFQKPSAAPSPTVGTARMVTSPNTIEGIKPPEKSLLGGATTKEQVAYMQKIKEHVYKKHNVTI